MADTIDDYIAGLPADTQRSKDEEGQRSILAWRGLRASIAVKDRREYRVAPGERARLARLQRVLGEDEGSDPYMEIQALLEAAHEVA